MKNYIAREGLPFILLFTLLSIICLYFFYNLAIIPLLLTFFCIYFFRDPERVLTDTKDMIVSPADGKIMSIEEINEQKYLNKKVIKVSIFLSVFDVHINRIPIDGKVLTVHNVGGIFLPAYKKDASDKNVRTYIILETNWGKVMVAQITGLIARRIVCRVKPGDNVFIGDRYGLIKFGSCTEIYMPLEAEILVKPGDKVRGGESIIAKLRN
ncbi:Phosphatidylserine decarboxylase [Candidatus Syntrophocurvum alkaliphilum]|uniref:Phosphatidylserine decarboxylase proenzyme n=1 Tax=Candidatus Syntrophocurvum alkaliphilum TaxID=2293317 RepID=A0A6I6DIS9_9FIRM|nr:phosphatidylserine decarboxylase family protein [Candidatus Syntrophocurvum alkaliphilum]QGT99411.1 Phosphatidylserine decarboxylase [Candidatus Syntrophocurvum alkaliphilum]